MVCNGVSVRSSNYSFFLIIIWLNFNCCWIYWIFYVNEHKQIERERCFIKCWLCEWHPSQHMVLCHWIGYELIKVDVSWLFKKWQFCNTFGEKNAYKILSFISINQKFMWKSGCLESVYGISMSFKIQCSFSENIENFDYFKIPFLKSVRKHDFDDWHNQNCFYWLIFKLIEFADIEVLVGLLKPKFVFTVPCICHRSINAFDRKITSIVYVYVSFEFFFLHVDV